MHYKTVKPSVSVLDQEWKAPEHKSSTFKFLSRWFPGIVDFCLHWYWYLTDREYRLAIDLDRIFRTRTERIDLLPEPSGERGFVLSVDRTTAFFFVQDEDRFFYEGWSLSGHDELYEEGTPVVSDAIRDFYDAKEAEDRGV